MKCPHCQQSIMDEAEYCEHCGHKLGPETNEAPKKKEEPSPTQLKEKREEEKGTKEEPRALRGTPKKEGVRKEDKDVDEDEEEEAGEERKTKNSEEDQKPPAGSRNKNAFLWKGLLVFIGAIFLTIFSYSYLIKKDRPPPIPEKTITGASESFYLALRENIYHAGNAKAYYRKGLSYMGPEGLPSTLPTTNPASMPAQQPSFLKAAENFALALENFNKAHDTIDNIRIKTIETDQAKCKSDFVQSMAAFISASQMLNDHAKALYMGDTKRAGQNFITDAQAKYGVADQSMTELLLGGCNGSYFKFLKGAPSTERDLAVAAYKSFFQDQFDLHRSAVELLMGYQPGESAPANPNP